MLEFDVPKVLLWVFVFDVLIAGGYAFGSFNCPTFNVGSCSGAPAQSTDVSLLVSLLGLVRGLLANSFILA